MINFRYNKPIQYVLFILVMLFGLNAICSAQSNSILVKGELSDKRDGMVYLTYDYHHQTITDSTPVTKGGFEGQFTLPEPLRCTLKISGNPRIKIFVANSGTAKVYEDSRNDIDIQLSDAALNNSLAQFNNLFSGVAPYVSAIRSIRAEGGDSLKLKHANALYQHAKDSIVSDFVKQNPESIIAAIAIIQTFMVYPDRLAASKLFPLLSDGVKQSEYGRNLGTFVNAQNVTAVGKQIPDFELPDSTGQNIAVTSFKGKYLLIDFWASWCGPCRKENPVLIEARKLYAHMGFEILGISLDRSRAAWLQAVRTDELTWPQLIDNRDFEGEVPSLFGVRSLPANFLIDPKGVIIAKGLRGDDLLSFLQKTLIHKQ